MVAQIYVDDIVFGGMSDSMVKHFANQMQAEFEMSLMGELTYFLGLQVTQMEDSTFLSQSKYARSIVKKFGIENASHKGTPTPTHLKLSKDTSGENVDQSLYKNTSEGCFFLGNNLVSWFSKKQNCVSLSTAEAEYIAAGSSCSQMVWMKQMLTEYNVT